MNKIANKQLPDGWAWTTMEHIADVVGGGTPKSKEKKYFEGGEIPWLTPADLSGYKDKFVAKGARNITENGLNSSSARIVPAGTVLFTSRAPIGYIAIASNDICTNQGFKSFVLKDKTIFPDYVYWWLKGNKQLAESFASGTTFLELSGSKAKQLPIPIAPPEQQKRIVAKIEELFSHIDAGIAGLKKTKQLLKQYRQSVLKAAVTGELTKEWREKNKDRLEPASKLLERILKERRKKWEEQQLEKFKAKGQMPKNDKWREKYKDGKPAALFAGTAYPVGWLLISLDQVAEVLLGKMLDKSKHTSGVKLPYLRNINVRWGSVVTDDVSEMFFKKEELNRYNLISGDVLVCEGGEPGRAAVWYDEISNMKYQKALHRVRFHLPLLPEYLSLLLEYYASTGLLAGYFTGSTIKHFTKESFTSLPFPLSSLDEMKKLTGLVEEKVICIKRLELEIKVQLAKAEKSKQSILSSAFSGKLDQGISNGE